MISRARLANQAWEALLGAHATLMKQFQAEDIWDELSMREYDVLYTLSKCDEPISLAELNRHVLLSQPAMSRLVDRLAERGLIVRQRSSEDGRSVLLSLTEAGSDCQRRIGLAHGAHVARLLSAALTREDMQTLARICGQLDSTTQLNDTAQVPV